MPSMTPLSRVGREVIVDSPVVSPADSPVGTLSRVGREYTAEVSQNK